MDTRLIAESTALKFAALRIGGILQSKLRTPSKPLVSSVVIASMEFITTPFSLIQVNRREAIASFKAAGKETLPPKPGESATL